MTRSPRPAGGGREPDRRRRNASAWTLALKSPPDGYTVLITNDNAASAPHIMSLSYDYTKELVPVIHLGRQPQILAAHPSLGRELGRGTRQPT